MDDVFVQFVFPVWANRLRIDKFIRTVEFRLSHSQDALQIPFQHQFRTKASQFKVIIFHIFFFTLSYQSSSYYKRLRVKAYSAAMVLSSMEVNAVLREIHGSKQIRQAFVGTKLPTCSLTACYFRMICV